MHLRTLRVLLAFLPGAAAMPRSRYMIHEPASTYFLTCTIVGWLPVFTRPEAAQTVLDSWRFLREHGRLTLYGYVIMENHLHLIASATELAKEIGDFKSFTARRILDMMEAKGGDTILDILRSLKPERKLDRKYQLWAEESHPQKILNQEMMLQKLDYIHNNPVRRGYVDDPTHWRYSSARTYAGQEGLVPIRMDW
jgi:putative transposase